MSANRGTEERNFAAAHSQEIEAEMNRPEYLKRVRAEVLAKAMSAGWPR